MRHPREWFSRLPLDDDGENPRRWYQRCYDSANTRLYPGPRWHLAIGDLLAETEYEYGEFAGAQFGVDVRLWENVGKFDHDDTDRWHDHSVSIIVWRWGVYFAWRGGRRAGR